MRLVPVGGIGGRMVGNKLTVWQGLGKLHIPGA